MSFNDLERGSGSNDTPLPLYRTDSPANQQPISPDFEKLSKRIGIQIFKINSNVTGIAKLISLPQKSNAQGKDWTKQIHDLTETTRELIKDGTDDIKALSTFPLPPATESNRSRLSAARLTQSKLQKDFQSAALSFQRVQKESVKKSKEALESERAKERERQARSSNSALVSSSSSQQKRSSSNAAALLQEEQGEAGSPLVELDSSSTTAQSSTNLQHQLQSLKQSGPTQAELEYQESLIASREAEIREIESGVQELNEIFRDLGNIVQEQGGMIDNIEFNVTSIATNTEGAERELVVAHEYQRKAGRRAACLLLVVGFVIAIVLVAILN